MLAITVVLTHSYGYALVGGRNAVQLFYIISGFLISYVIYEQKKYRTALNFYISRYLRIFPVYATVAFATMAMFLGARFLLHKEMDFFNVYAESPFSAKFLLWTSNTFVFFQDWVMFFGIKDHQLTLTTDFLSSKPALFRGLLIPQAWTLGVELSFYMVAPFLLTRRNTLIFFLLVSLAVRLYLLTIGLGRNDPWTYRFFPTELALFLFGALSQQTLLPFYRRVLTVKNMKMNAKFATLLLAFLILIFWMIPINHFAKSIALLAFFFFLLPLAFTFQSQTHWDKWIGELSYPIYICHVLVINLIGGFLGKSIEKNSVTFSAIVVTGSICLAMALNVYVAKPVEALRSRFRATA